jgi:hypothetical protein
MTSSATPRLWTPPRSAFAGFRFPLEVIVLAVRWYLRFNLSYRDIGVTTSHLPELVASLATGRRA